MLNKAEAIQLYILAKDSNRPFFLNDAFAQDAILHLDVKTEAIVFPSSCCGREAIADTLVRQFNHKYENIYTVCIGDRPDIDGVSFSCNWMVVMTEKQSRSLRVGCGFYEWNFSSTDGKVQSLRITIDIMETAASVSAAEAMTWVSALPYPWCVLPIVAKNPPDIAAVHSVIEHLKEEV